ncbi:19573_t:CDS:1 [Funneliformis geosporum]|uniref:8767_t:CDS:1 n=1 Tax=Funneliformis geosporum TaxID=1117311 RepID=A0A9W4SEL1_9GLOM|nr:8767_t:CDS:1 [Funneliformis geosporum]CAI2174408.1 19573_t:CDS:1 [Funneliformis geosporum]
MKMKNNNNHKPSILTIIFVLIIFTTYSVITHPTPSPENDNGSISPRVENPDPSLPTLTKFDFESLSELGEFWEMIRTDDFTDQNVNKENFGTKPYFTPVWFKDAFYKFGPHITYTNKDGIAQVYKDKEWYYICYLKTCMNVVFRGY